ncbi:hypothetical protein CUC44_04160 [Aeromonas lusitana]|uniref:Uncharacterized protein n=1 Tax=Aeromonas lusitana TaxID=931529 RepID=A0A2M8HD68_9GAMM|nr:hypothetical protein CUC44_04160 [Aeromonas lusitana]
MFESPPSAVFTLDELLFTLPFPASTTDVTTPSQFYRRKCKNEPQITKQTTTEAYHASAQYGQDAVLWMKCLQYQ